MISKLPKWIEYGSFVLAFVAGCINAIGLLGFDHQSVSHLSGTATLLGTSIFDGSFHRMFHLIGVLLAFFMGALLSGFLVHGSTIKLGQHYDTALVLESLLIFIGLYLLSIGSYYGHFFASAACGVQNALVTKYSGAVIRTTHLTGIFTDLGIMVGSVLRGESFDRRKATIFILIIVGFIIGGSFGAYLFGLFRFQALLAPASICLVLAAIYNRYSKKQLSNNNQGYEE